MSDTAAYLADNFFPFFRAGQWVLRMPREVRYRLAYAKKLLSKVRAVFLRGVQVRFNRKAWKQGPSSQFSHDYREESGEWLEEETVLSIF